jgi:hypothetical protein
MRSAKTGTDDMKVKHEIERLSRELIKLDEPECLWRVEVIGRKPRAISVEGQTIPSSSSQARGPIGKARR